MTLLLTKDNLLSPIHYLTNNKQSSNNHYKMWKKVIQITRINYINAHMQTNIFTHHQPLMHKICIHSLVCPLCLHLWIVMKSPRRLGHTITPTPLHEMRHRRRTLSLPTMTCSVTCSIISRSFPKPHCHGYYSQVYMVWLNHTTLNHCSLAY